MTDSAPRSVRLRLESLEDREIPAILFGVTPSNQLVTFDSANPTALLSSIPITGFFAAGEVIRDIDVAANTGSLIGRSNFDRLFLISPTNPFAIPFGTPLPITPGPLGMDIDPRNDQIRLWSNVGENVVLNGVNGSLIRIGVPLSYAPGDLFHGTQPRVAGMAFLNSVPAATFTGVYAIDHFRNTLVRPGSQSLNDGLLATVGGLGVNVGSRVGFDIAPFTNAAFASFQINGQGVSRLYTVNLGTGRATSLGRIGAGLILNDIAVDLRGTSGFTSAAGFNALPPPPPVSFNFGFGAPSSTFTVSSSISPTGSSVTIGRSF